MSILFYNIYMTVFTNVHPVLQYIYDIKMLDSYFSIVNCFSPREFASLQWTTIVRHNVSM